MKGPSAYFRVSPLILSSLKMPIMHLESNISMFGSQVLRVPLFLSSELRSITAKIIGKLTLKRRISQGISISWLMQVCPTDPTWRIWRLRQYFE